MVSKYSTYTYIVNVLVITKSHVHMIAPIEKGTIKEEFTNCERKRVCQVKEYLAKINIGNWNIKVSSAGQNVAPDEKMF